MKNGYLSVYISWPKDTYHFYIGRYDPKSGLIDEKFIPYDFTHWKFHNIEDWEEFQPKYSQQAALKDGMIKLLEMAIVYHFDNGIFLFKFKNPEESVMWELSN